MKNLFLLLILGLLLTSCDKGDTIAPEQDLSTSLNLKITKLNSPDNQTYSVHLKDFTKKYSNWTDNTQWGENISIVKSISFNTKLPTEEEVEIEIWFQKNESEELLKLNANEIPFDSWRKHKEWDYISYADEISNFYNNHGNRDLIINKSNHISRKDMTFDIVKTAEVNVNGEPKTRLTIKLKGDLYPAFSAHTPADAKYRIEGEFSGIIE